VGVRKESNGGTESKRLETTSEKRGISFSWGATRKIQYCVKKDGGGGAPEKNKEKKK